MIAKGISCVTVMMMVYDFAQLRHTTSYDNLICTITFCVEDVC